MSDEATSSENGAARDVVVIEGSAGAIPTLTTIVAELPPATAACVLIVVHSPTDGLSGILERVSPLPVVHGPRENGFRPAIDPLFSALVSAMPINALNAVDVDYVRRAADIGSTIARLTKNGAPSVEHPDVGDRKTASSEDLEPQLPQENLESEQRHAVDNALWSAVRVLEEHADLKGRIARRAAANGMELGPARGRRQPDGSDRSDGS